MFKEFDTEYFQNWSTFQFWYKSDNHSLHDDRTKQEDQEGAGGE
jgi:hypothetical protein